MSIYTDMIAHIEANGIGVGNVFADPNESCCLFGIKARIEGYDAGNFQYETNSIPELVTLVKKYMPTDTINNYSLSKDKVWDYRWVYAYNDSIINGDATHAIRLLEEAEKLRIKNEINL